MKSASSSITMNKDEQVTQHKVNETRWLDAFLGTTFFGSCAAHTFRKNELNTYCINCSKPVCLYCMSSGHHHDHNMLKIHIHVYKDVVSLDAIEKYIECSQIQPYKCNKQLVISLNPLPHCGSTSSNGESCNICSRKLTEPNLYSFCSISYKVKSFSRKPNDSVPPFISIDNHPHERQEETSEPQKPQKRRRKGTPHRAPFF